MRNLAFLLCLIAAPSFACEENRNLCNQGHGIIKVESDYEQRDLSTGELLSARPITFGGAAIPVKVGERLFILTTAHLTQGDAGTEPRFYRVARERGRMSREQMPVRIIGRLANNDLTDLEVIEVDPENTDLQPLVEFRESQLWMTRESMQRIFSSLGHAPLQNEDPCFATMSSVSNEFLMLNPWLRMQIPGVMLSHVTGSNFSLNLDDSVLNHSPVSESATFGKEWLVSMSIIGGVSGSPMFKVGRRNGQYGYRLSGIAKRYSRNFQRSYFAKSEEVVNLLNEYLQLSESSSLGAEPAIRWRAHGQLLTRDYGGGTLEINPEQLPSGGTETGDGGGTETGDGGGTETGDGGGTETGDGGGTPTCRRRILDDPSQAWGAFHLRPGLRREGREVIGFRVRGQAVHLAADAFALEYLRHQDLAEVSEITRGASVIDLFTERTGDTRKRTYYSATFNLQHADLDQIVSPQTLTLVDSPEGRRLVFELLGVRGEELRFHIGEQGQVFVNVGAAEQQIYSEYQPVIAVPAQGGGTYYIDLSGLFFDHSLVFADQMSPHIPSRSSGCANNRYFFISIRRRGESREQRLRWHCSPPLASQRRR